jgi:hypothetical protein
MPSLALGQLPLSQSSITKDTAVFWRKLAETQNFKNEAHHSTQLNETSKTRYILFTEEKKLIWPSG